MNAQLELANALGQRTRDELDELLRFRPVAHPDRIRDALDLAEALLKPDSIRDALQRSTRETLDFLSGVSDSCPDEAWLHGLVATELTSSSPAAPKRLSEVSEALESLLDAQRPATTHEPAYGTEQHSGAEPCFTSIRITAQLLRALGDAATPLRQRGNELSLPALRRMSELLGLDSDDLATRIAVLFDAGLLTRRVGKAARTQAGTDWLGKRHAEQLITLVKGWFVRQPEAFQSLMSLAAEEGMRVNTSLLLQRYPLAPETLRDSFSACVRAATLLGLLVDETPTELGVSVLRGDDAAAVSRSLPQTIEQVYVQPDLTVIAPGPLDSAREESLLTFAELEQAGIASSYRITAQSLERALDRGMTETEIRELLEQLSLTGIPQPLDYQLRESASRQGSLIVRASGDGQTEIVCATAELALQLSVDRALAALRLEKQDEGHLVTALSSAHVAQLLRASGYPATLAHEREPANESDAAANESDEERELLIKRILLSATDQHSESAHERLLELAVRKKQRVRVVLHQANADDRSFVLRPVGLRNGRLRGIDEVGQVERTLPVAELVTVEPLLGVGE